jgi:hypothetical protein
MAYNILVREPDGERSLGILKRKWEDNIQMDIKLLEFKSLHWI